MTKQLLKTKKGLVLLFAALFSLAPTAHAQIGDIFGSLSGLVGDYAECKSVNEATEELLESLEDIKNSIGGEDEVPVIDNDVIALLTKQWIKESVVDCTVWATSKGVIEQLTTSMVGWVNTGFDGEPFYVRNLAEFYAGIEDESTRLFAEELSGSPLNDSFKDLIVSNLVSSNSRVSFSDTATCDTDRTLEETLALADAGEGFDELLTIIQDPACTAPGAYALAQDELARRQALIASEASTQLSYGQGFLPQMENGRVVTPGSIIRDVLTRHLESGLEQLELSDELSEIIGVLATYLYDLVVPNTGGLYGGSVTPPISP